MLDSLIDVALPILSPSSLAELWIQQPAGMTKYWQAPINPPAAADGLSAQKMGAANF
jgi:hypothetical protein